jgi:alpha-mannosidase
MANGDGSNEVLFAASAPAMGYRTFWLKNTVGASTKGATVKRLPNGKLRLETDFYQAEVDPEKGGTFSSLVAKRLGNRELVDVTNARRFNEIRGFFFRDGRFYSTTESAAKVEIVEAGPVRLRLRVSSQIASNAVSQWVTMLQGEPRIDFRVRIDWQGSPGIGAGYGQNQFRREEDRKAFYDDREKLLVLFPLNLDGQAVFKDAPFDVTESRLTNTFFETWSGIKNNVILHWVDVRDSKKGVGMSLLTDHTTSYAHGADHPLGLTLQYSGVGLWGRNYSLQGPTEVNYALLPHGAQDTTMVWSAGCEWNEPLFARVCPAKRRSAEEEKSFLTIEGADCEVTSLRVRDGKILVRLFNLMATERTEKVDLGFSASRIELVQLNGRITNELAVRRNGNGHSRFEVPLRPRAFATVQLSP